MYQKIRIKKNSFKKFKLKFFLSSKLNFDLYFDLCQRAEVIHVGLNMHLYDDIRDASSSLRGSTSSYASSTSGEAYRDRRLTTNFELWVEIFCVPTCFHVRIPKPCLSVRLHPEKRNHHSFVNISPTLVIDASMERSSRVLQHENPKIWKKKLKKVCYCNSKFDFWRRAEITLASSISVLH